MKTMMQFRIELLDTRGCSISSELVTSAKITISPPQTIMNGKGYVEFIKDSYAIEPSQARAKIRLRRRGSYGRVKKAEIFTRDLTAEEGRDYFCNSNEMGTVVFGPAEIYKEVTVKIAKARGLSERSFKLELGNNEDTYDMNRQFETQVTIKPADYDFSYSQCSSSISDFRSESFASALEQVEQNFANFDSQRAGVTRSHALDGFAFEKRAFFFWLEDGIISVILQTDENVRGKWKTIDNDKSAIASKHYEPTSGTFQSGFNKLKITIHQDDQEMNTVGFGIEAIDEQNNKVQTVVVLQPFDYES